VREPINDLASPSLAVLTLQNLIPDTPIEQNQFAVHGESSAYLRRPNLALQPGQQVLIALRIRNYVGHVSRALPLTSMRRAAARSSDTKS
jgi:hypothetical protein